MMGAAAATFSAASLRGEEARGVAGELGAWQPDNQIIQPIKDMKKEHQGRLSPSKKEIESERR